MNKAWLVRRYEGDEWEIVFQQPDRYHYEVKEIAWVELTDGVPT